MATRVLLVAAVAAACEARVHRCSDVTTNHRIAAAKGDLAALEHRSADACAHACEAAARPQCSAWSFDALGGGGCVIHHGSENSGKLVPAAGWVAAVCSDGGVDRGSAPRDFPLLPGLDYFEKGIEAIQDVINRTQHVRLPVYGWSTKLGHSWYDPETQQTYAIPDQLSFTANPAGYEQIDDLYTATYTQTITEVTNSVTYGGSIGINYAGIGASVSYSENKQWYNYFNEVHSENNYVSHSLLWLKYFELEAYPMNILGTQGLDPLFVQYLKTLPATITNSSDLSKYNFLVANWGTHYVKWANFGGRLQLDIFTDKNFTSTMSQQWLYTQHSLEFHFQLYAIDASAQAAGYHNKSEIHRNSSFLEHSRTDLYYEGGNPAFMDTSNLVAWKDSVAAEPHWLNVSLVPLYTLPVLTAQQQATLENFTNVYLSRNTTNPPSDDSWWW